MRQRRKLRAICFSRIDSFRHYPKTAGTAGGARALPGGIISPAGGAPVATRATA